MRYRTSQLDHVRWRHEALAGEITTPPSMGTFTEFQGQSTAYLGWHHDDKTAGNHVSIQLTHTEAEHLYQILGQRLRPGDKTIGVGIDTDLRCACGGATHSSIGTRKTVYTCISCGQWVATLTHETASGATIEGEPLP